MEKAYFDSPIFSLSPLERVEREHKAQQMPVYDPDLSEMAEGPLGRFVLGNRNTLTGTFAWYLGEGIGNAFDDTEDYPLNLTKSKNEFDPLKDDITISLGNNPETILEDLKDVPFEQWSYILSGKTYGQFKDRLRFVKAGLPMAEPLGVGGIVGTLGDIGSMVSIGMAAEPLALAGLGARTTLAGRAAASSTGMFRHQALGQAAAEAAATISKTNLAARFTALGIAEEAVYQSVRNGLDPTYQPETSAVVQDLALSGITGGLLGGAMFGRTFLKEQIEDAAKEFKALKTVNLPGGYTVTYADRLAFDSPAAADRMLFAPGTGDLRYEAERVGQEVADLWQKNPDLFIPGTRTVSNLPIMGGTFPSAQVGIGGEITSFLPVRELPFQGRAAGNNLNLSDFGTRFWHTSDDPRVVSALFEEGQATAEIPLTVDQRVGAISIEFEPGKIKGRLLGQSGRTFETRYRGGDITMAVSSIPKNLGKNIRAVSVDTAEMSGEGAKAIDDVLTKRGFIAMRGGGTEIQYVRPGLANVAQPLTKKGLRWNIQRMAKAVQDAGATLEPEIFKISARALASVERLKLKDPAKFNEFLWQEMDSLLRQEGKAAIADLLNRSRRPFISAPDRTLLDVAARGDMADEIFVKFVNKDHLKPGAERSLIFQILEEVSQRGGQIDRPEIERIIDELREVSQNPPTRINAKGRKVLDTNARRLAVAQIVNRRVKGGKEVYIAESLLSKMKAIPGGRSAAGAIVRGTGTTPSGTSGASDFSDVPQLRRLFTERLPIWEKLGNQSARLLQSDNGAARLIGWMAFNARRSFDIAQPQTIMEAGTSVLHTMMFSFMRGYRNQYLRFALGNGNANVPLDNIDLVDRFKKAFGQAEMRRDFNRRVAQQLRTGAYDDALDAVNDAAKGFREIFDKMHDMAASVGLRGFTKGKTENYMPRLWRFEKIRRLATTADGKKALIALVRNSIDQNGRRVIIDGVEQTITGDIDEAATAFANRLIAIATKTENAPLLEHEQDLFEALQGLVGPLKAKTPSKTPFGRARILLDEQASVRLAGDPFNDGKTVLSIADLTNDDLPFVFRKYITSMMGAINEKRLLNAFNDELRIRGVFSPSYVTKTGETIKNQVEVQTVEEMISLATKLGGEVDPGHMEGLREVIAAIRYEPIHRGTAGFGDKALGIALPYGYLITGGQFGLAAMGEISRILSTVGWRQMLKQMPVLSEMFGNWKNMDKEAQNFSSFIDTWFAPSTDRLRRAFMDVTGSPAYEVGGSRGYRYVKGTLDSVSNLMSDISGLAPITSFSQQLAAATTLQHLYDVAKGGAKRLDTASVRSLGLEPQQYEDLIQFVGKNAKVRKGFLGDRITDMDNLDAKEMDLLKGFVQRVVTTRIQDMPTRGDFHKYAFTFWGRLFTQFRTFNLKGIDNFLIQNAGRAQKGAGIQVAQEIAATMLMAGVIQYARNYGDYRSYMASGNRDKAKELEKTLTVAGAIRGAATGPSEFFLPVQATDALWTNFVDKDPIFSPYRYSGLAWYGFPGEAIMSRSWSVGKDLYGRSVGKTFDLSVQREITRGTLHKARLLTPMQNMPIFKQFFNIAEEDFALEANLPKTQPRTTD